MATAEYRVDKLLEMTKRGEKLYPWQMVILQKNMYKLVYDCHGSDLYCIGCGMKHGRGHYDRCIFKEE